MAAGTIETETDKGGCVMTVSEFQSRCKKSVKTIHSWLRQGYLPGAVQDPATGEWDIPEHAREPYTGTRAKTARATCASMVQAANRRQHIVPALYHLDPSEFEGYIDALVDADLLCRRTVDGVTYYDATLKGQEYASLSGDKLKKLVGECLSTAVVAIVKGCTSAVLEAGLGKVI